ncbi:MAG: response regulator [Phycisphaerae bacterium]|jgi:CheY-like chemotaxis protein|nr:response regulator [Phycisphaerae bacterium]
MTPTPNQEQGRQTHHIDEQRLTDRSIGCDHRRDVRILLVEDSRINREVALHILRRKLGYTADTACDGNEALQALATQAYDLVLMDCQMPGMDGYEATRTIRDPGSDVLDHKVKIVAITANAMKGDREKCLQAGMDDYVTKPVKPQTLADVIERNLYDAESAHAKAPESTGPSCNTVESQWIDDPELAGILDDFVEGLPGKVAAMREALANNCFDEVRRIAHQLKGAGGGYGYPALTESARGLENAAQARCPETALLALVQLGTLCQAVQAGHKAHTVVREDRP